MRLFIAIKLTKDLQNELSTLQDKLKTGPPNQSRVSSPDVKWVKPENIHLTLKFLGETEEAKINLIKDILNQTAAKFKEFSLEISNLGTFTPLEKAADFNRWPASFKVNDGTKPPSAQTARPIRKKFSNGVKESSSLTGFTNLKNPRVIWIGATEEYKNVLAEIVGIIETDLEKIGFVKEKRGFQSHITLGRVRSAKNINALKDNLIKNAEFKAGILKIASISLIQSKLTAKDPEYALIHTAKLLAATV